MTRPNTRPLMSKDQLPGVGDLFFEVADRVTDQSVARNIVVSGIVPAGPHGLIEALSDSSESPLNFLQILWAAADIETYIGSEKETTRTNVGTMAHLGGFAVVQMCDQVMDKLTPQVFTSVHGRLLSVQTKLETAHRTTIRDTGADRHVSRLLADTRRVLMPGAPIGGRPIAPTE